MKAMIWKEWRENAKWAGLAFVTMSLAILYFCYVFLDANNQQVFLVPLEAIAPVGMFMVPLFAAVLGILQVGSELRRDQWAFLMHRPVSRSVILGGKAIGGLSLYVLATAAPIGLLTLWTLMPGNVPAPFDWHQLLAPLANILAGIPFYFAGMLVAVRPARWYGSRLLAFAPAILCLFLVNIVPEFWHALLAAIIWSAILLTAAWGSFLSSGNYEAQPKIAKIALGLSLYIGIVCTVGTATMFVVFTKSAFDRSPRPGSYYMAGRQQFGITQAGQIIRYKYNRNGALDETYDLQGRVVSLPPKDRASMIPPSNFLYRGSSLRFEDRSYRSVKRYWVALNNVYRGVEPTVYYWVSGKRYIEAYSREGNIQTGTIGLNGYVPMVAGTAKPFPEEKSNWMESYLSLGQQILAFPHLVYVLDTRSKTVTPIFSTSDPKGIQGISTLNGYGEGGSDTIAIAAEGKIFFRNGKGKRLFETPLIETPLKNLDMEDISLTVSTSPQTRHFFIWYSSVLGSRLDISKTPASFIKEFTRNGKLVKEYNLPALKQPVAPLVLDRFWYEEAAIATEYPPVALAYGVAYANRLYQNESAAYRDTMVNQMRSDFLRTLIVSVLLMPLTFLAARRARLNPRATIGWTMVTLFLGLSALLLLLALHHWPAQVACPNCGRKRSVENELCEHCDAAFPFPEHDETAVFEDRLEEADVDKLLTRV